MLANKMIDDSKSYITIFETERDRDAIYQAIKYAEQSIKFDIGAVEDLITVGRDKKRSEFILSSKEVINLLPFDCCLFQMELPKTDKPIFILIKKLNNNEFVFYVWSAMTVLKKSYLPANAYYLVNTEDNTTTTTQLDLSAEKLTDQENDVFFKQRLEPVVYALRMMACSNIETIDNIPSRLKQSRVKKGKSPLFEYKTLHVTGAPKTKNKYGNGGSHASPRVHLRRGHIRKLSETKSVWVQPCVVGDKSKGVIHKDYNFSTAA